MKMGAAEVRLKMELEGLYGAGEAEAMTAMVLEHLTSHNHQQRWENREMELAPDVSTQLDSIIERLLLQEPLQYILQKSWFYGLELYVDGQVLIPRPETEELVDWIIRDVKTSGFPAGEPPPLTADKTTQLKIMDVGTGSGCIALALKRNLPLAEVWGCDASDGALNVARRNGANLDIRVDFQGLDFLDEAQRKQLPTVDIAVSNPPYIPQGEKDSMPYNVVAHEPHLALFVPDQDPLVFYRALAQYGYQRLHEGGRMYLEIHESLGKEVMALLEASGYKNIQLRKDMQGKERMVRAERKSKVKIQKSKKFRS
jgi:release factor glutamine methyltransferase